jgi:hypothetical protein
MVVTTSDQNMARLFEFFGNVASTFRAFATHGKSTSSRRILLAVNGSRRPTMRILLAVNGSRETVMRHLLAVNGFCELL